MLDTLLSALFGGTTGLIGSVLTGVLGVWQKKIELEKLGMEMAHAERLHALEMEARKLGFQHEMELAEINTAASMRTASYEHDTGTGKADRWVINILRLVRPFLTFCLIALTAAIYFFTIQGSEMTSIVNTVTYSTTSAVLWWFGDRAQAAHRKV